MIASKINRHVVTVNKFVNDPLKKRKIRAGCGFRKSVSKRDLNSLKRKLRKLPEATNGGSRVSQNKLTSHTYCQFLKSFLEPWLEDVPLSRLRNLIYMHDDAPSHAAKATTQYLESIGFKNKTMMIWPPNSPDLNPMENLWSIIKQRVYADGKQYSSKDTLWEAIKQAADSIPRFLIRKLTEPVNERFFDIIRLNGSHVGK